jgi:ATP synthase mitochondrial F1 complex assembly factor 2
VSVLLESITIMIRYLSLRTALSLRRGLRRFSSEVAPASGRLTDLSGLGPKRFYKKADVMHDADSGHFAVVIDGRRVRTPRRSVLSAPTEALAISLACEWDAQKDRIRPSSMPLTALVATATDIVPEFRSRIISSVTKYIDTDALCIRPAHPERLVMSQADTLHPVLQYFKDHHGQELEVAIGGLTARQSDGLHNIVTDFVNSLPDLGLAAMDSAAATCKSVMIAMALHDRAIDADAAVAAARYEEGWQEGIWGTVEGGHDLDTADVRVRLTAADTIFRMISLAPSDFTRTETDPQ